MQYPLLEIKLDYREIGTRAQLQREPMWFCPRITGGKGRAVRAGLAGPATNDVAALRPGGILLAGQDILIRPPAGVNTTGGMRGQEAV